MIILIIFFLATISYSKTIEIQISDNISYTYVDVNNDGVFDSLVKIKDNDSTVIMLNQVESKPSKVEFNHSVLEAHLLNYNNVFQDAYFQIRVVNNGKVTGYYEHIMGRNELQYFETND